MPFAIDANANANCQNKDNKDNLLVWYICNNQQFGRFIVSTRHDTFNTQPGQPTTTHDTQQATNR